jgi:hypothetical protein
LQITKSKVPQPPAPMFEAWVPQTKRCPRGTSRLNLTQSDQEQALADAHRSPSPRHEKPSRPGKTLDGVTRIAADHGSPIV